MVSDVHLVCSATFDLRSLTRCEVLQLARNMLLRLASGGIRCYEQLQHHMAAAKRSLQVDLVIFHVICNSEEFAELCNDWKLGSQLESSVVEFLL